MKKFIYTIVIIFTFFIGCISSYFTYNYLNKENSNVKSVMNEVSITESDSIRDVIAFPKNASATCPMSKAPNSVEEDQLKELGIGVLKDE